MFFGVRDEEKMWFQAYLENRLQRVISGHSFSSWLVPRLGVPQGSILGPLLFVMFVNDLPTVISRSSVNMYADDTTLYYGGANVNDSIQVLQEDAQSVLQWFNCNGLTVNLKKTNLMISGRRRREKEFRDSSMLLDGVELLPKTSVKYLGVELDSNLEWKKHVMNLRAKCLLALRRLSRISRDLPQETRKRLYSALVQPHVDYCCVVWDRCSKHLQTKVETIQNRGMRYILKSPWSTTGTELREKLGWTTLSQRRNLLTLKTIHKCIHKRGPTYLHEKFIKQSDMGNSRTRGASKLYLHRPRTDFYKNSFEYSGAKLWNSLPDSVRNVTSRLGFSSALQHYFNSS